MQPAGIEPAQSGLFARYVTITLRLHCHARLVGHRMTFLPSGMTSIARRSEPYHILYIEFEGNAATGNRTWLSTTRRANWRSTHIKKLRMLSIKLAQYHNTMGSIRRVSAHSPVTVRRLSGPETVNGLFLGQFDACGSTRTTSSLGNGGHNSAKAQRASLSAS